MERVPVKSSCCLAIAMIVMLAGYVEAQSGWWSTTTTTPTTSVPDIYECASAPCNNGGTCVGGVNSYHCYCTGEFTGYYCETAINPCSSEVCFNGGTCKALSGFGQEFICICEPGFAGGDCSIDIDECAGAVCHNGGLCVDRVNSYYCQCIGEFTGYNCEMALHPCSSEVCFNGGTCKALSGFGQEFICICEPGFAGGDCSIDFNECISDPCLNGGTCVDGVNSYSCGCTVRWTGTYCETPQVDPFDNCPESIRVDLPRGETQAYVTWDKPRVQVDSSTAPGKVNASHTPGSLFSVGHHRVVYKYIYGTFPLFLFTSKYKECKFDINITSLLGPFVQSCPQDVQIDLPRNEDMAYVTWSEPRVIGLGTDHVVSFVVDKERKTHPGSYFSVGETNVTYQLSTLNQTESQLCSFSVGVRRKIEPGAPPVPVNGNYCSYTDTLILGSLLAVAIVSSIGSCSLYFRMKRSRPSSGVTRSMVPLDTISKPKTVNNSGSFADSVDPPRYTNRNINHGPPSLPPVPPPKPSVPLPMDDPGLQNTYEALDNYGYMCLDLKKQNRDAYQMPRALYEKQNY